MNQEANEISYFDKLRVNSQYHFDATKHDLPGEWFTVHGRFDGDWDKERKEVIANSTAINWETLATSLNNAPMTRPLVERIRLQENDISRGGGDPKMELVSADTRIKNYPVLVKMVDFFGLENIKVRAHAQITGQVFNYHIDSYPHYSHVDQSRLIRFIVFLEDWQPGHFYIYGTHTLSHWKAGEFHTFKWADVPHATANASSCPRTSLVVTGLKTDRTEEILKSPYQTYKI